MIRRSFLLSAVFVLLACNETPTHLCVPGVSQACACVGGATGAQSCLQDGTGFAPCVCSPSASELPTAPGTPSPSAAAPTGDDAYKRFVPLQRPWSRLVLIAECGAEERYGHLRVVPQSTWNPPGGPAITLTADLVTTGGTPENDEDVIPHMIPTALRLFGAWPGSNRRRVLVSRAGVSPGCGEHQPDVVYAGVREDGLLLVSLERLPWAPPGEPDMPGYSKRALLRWDTASQQIRSVDHWQGPTREAPAHLRIRPL